MTAAAPEGRAMTGPEAHTVLHLVLVDKKALVLSVPATVECAFLHPIADIDVPQAGSLRYHFARCTFPCAWSASHEYIWRFARRCDHRRALDFS